jgi:tRNA pseudouridine32 synthase/23S rRNA pseudouridine746 synthase
MIAAETMSIAPTAARVYLPVVSQPPPTVFAFLCQHFPQIEEERWLRRIREGKVSSERSALIDERTPYQHGTTIFYFREVAEETEIPFREEILFQNDHLLVAEKPHFLPVTPAGDCINECLLYRLQRRTAISDLAPLHRLDRDTAGLVLFSTCRATRGIYHDLFARNTIRRKYLAVAEMQTPKEFVSQTWKVENRLEAGDPWFRMAAVDGPVNARTEIVLKTTKEKLALFELHPQTGKKHQLRLHLSASGFSIVNDNLYPNLCPQPAEDYSSPLQLLASGLSFEDPVSNEILSFQSRQKLICWRE